MLAKIARSAPRSPFGLPREVHAHQQRRPIPIRPISLTSTTVQERSNIPEPTTGSSGGYGPRARCTSARACSQALWSPAWSALRARAIAAATASTFCDDTSPSLVSAATIEPGVG
jgi:hypothetical protein